MKTIKATVALLRVSEGITLKPDRRLFPAFTPADLVPGHEEQALPDDGVAMDAQDDHLAELIRGLTPADVEKLWSILIQLKPHLSEY